MDAIEIMLPNFVKINQELLEDIDNKKLEYPAAFENYLVTSVHGPIDELYWYEKARLSGSTEAHGVHFEKEKNTFAKKRYKIFLDLSNPLLNHDDCLDRYGNKVLRSFDDENNGIILSSEALLSYVQSHFPKYCTCWKFFYNYTAENIVQKLNDVDFVLLPTSAAYNDMLMNSIPHDQRGRCILTINSLCSENCPNFIEHLLGGCHIACNMENETTIDICPIYYGRMSNNGTTVFEKRLSEEKITNDLSPLGYKKFYIDCSTLNEYHFLQEIVKTMVKEQYQLEAYKTWFNIFRNKVQDTEE